MSVDRPRDQQSFIQPIEPNERDAVMSALQGAGLAGVPDALCNSTILEASDTHYERMRQLKGSVQSEQGHDGNGNWTATAKTSDSHEVDTETQTKSTADADPDAQHNMTSEGEKVLSPTAIQPVTPYQGAEVLVHPAPSTVQVPSCLSDVSWSDDGEFYPPPSASNAQAWRSFQQASDVVSCVSGSPESTLQFPSNVSGPSLVTFDSPHPNAGIDQGWRSHEQAFVIAPHETGSLSSTPQINSNGGHSPITWDHHQMSVEMSYREHGIHHIPAVGTREPEFGARQDFGYNGTPYVATGYGNPEYTQPGPGVDPDRRLVGQFRAMGLDHSPTVGIPHSNAGRGRVNGSGPQLQSYHSQNSDPYTNHYGAGMHNGMSPTCGQPFYVQGSSYNQRMFPNTGQGMPAPAAQPPFDRSPVHNSQMLSNIQQGMPSPYVRQNSSTPNDQHGHPPRYLPSQRRQQSPQLADPHHLPHNDSPSHQNFRRRFPLHGSRPARGNGRRVRKHWGGLLDQENPDVPRPAPPYEAELAYMAVNLRTDFGHREALRHGGGHWQQAPGQSNWGMGGGAPGI
ncbi:hypothetical protein HDK64DRAFT_270258 [Phyllosticta capitalensis]